MLEVLGTGRAPATSAVDRGEAGDVRVLLIVARHESQLFLRTCIRFFGQRGIEVLLDRRRGQRRQTTARCQHDRRRADRRHSVAHWEDLHHHPVTIVPVLPAGRDVIRLPHPTSSGEDIMETIEDFTHTKARLDEWTREGQQLIGHVIPSLIDDCHSHHQLVLRLRQEIKDKDAEIATLRSEIDELKRERTELAEATSTYLNEINRITTEVARRLRGPDERVRAKSSLRAV
jgi:hypothetical protein